MILLPILLPVLMGMLVMAVLIMVMGAVLAGTLVSALASTGASLVSSYRHRKAEPGQEVAGQVVAISGTAGVEVEGDWPEAA